MDYRKLFLRVALLTLVGTGVVGGAMLVAGIGGDIGKVVWTGVCAAFAAGLMYPLLGWIDQPKLRGVGVFAASALVIDLLLVLAAIWLPSLLFGRGWGWRFQEHLALSAFVFFLCAVPATLLLRWRDGAAVKYAATVGVFAAGVCFVVSMLGIWGLPGGQFEEVIAATIFFCIISTLCTVNAGLDRRHWRWAGVAAAGTTVVVTFDQCWSGILEEPGAILKYSIAAAVVAAYCNMMMALRLQGRATVLRLVCVCLALATGALFAFMVLTEWDRFTGAGDPLPVRLFAAMALATSCATVALVVVHRMTVRRTRLTGEELPTLAVIQCPRCDRKQSVLFGESSCCGCGMALVVRAYDVRCPACGYDVSGLTEARCPECNTRLLLRA